MYALLKHSQEEIDAVIIDTAAKKGARAAIVDKDLWVSLTLDYLFHHRLAPLRRSLVRLQKVREYSRVQCEPRGFPQLT